MDTRPIRVLLVDDDEDDYIITRDLLSDIKGDRFDLAWVATYDAAIEAIGQNDHDVYLLDFHLGERDGLELLREAMANGCKAPMILLTGQGDHQVDIAAMQAGAADYLVKGQIEASLLERSIRYAIERARLIEGLEVEVAARTAEIRAEREKSETILRNVGDAIVMTDLELQIRYVNATFTTLTGYTAEEAIGQHVHLLEGEALPEQIRQSLQLALAQGEVWQGEVSVRRKDSRPYEAGLTIAPMRDAEGRLVGYVSSHQDISRLKELDAARSRFIASISHELRTPVANMKLYTQLLRRGQRLGKTEQYIQALEEQSARLGDLVQGILEMTELDSDNTVIAWEPLRLSTVVGTAVTRFQNQAEASGLTLVDMPLPPDLPVVKGDQMRLTQALSELVENAVLFTPAGGRVKVRVTNVEEERQHWVTIAVRDTGPGIPSEEHARLFDRFYRGSLALSGQVPGAGLGLSKVQEIMHAHGGRMTLASEPCQGRTFTLWLRSGSN
jgi:PAS domain S-box-containing protein